MTHRTRRIAGLAALALAVGPALAFAGADPAPDANYAGETSQSKLRFEFSTSADGSQVERLFAQYKAPHCENAVSKAQGSIRQKGLAITDGNFARRGKEVATLKPQGSFAGGKQIERFSIRGHFVSQELARGTLNVKLTIKSKSGAIISTCVHNKPITWFADRLGVGAETEE
jgi:hypothetical protein